MHLEALLNEIKNDGLVFSEAGNLAISKKGRQFDWMFDLRRALLKNANLQIIAQEFWTCFKPYGSFQIASIETASIPMMTAFSLLRPSDRIEPNCFIIRKQRKTTGSGQLIEGKITDEPIILVDDTINSGSSLEKAISILRSTGHKIKAVFTVVDFRSRKGLSWREANGIPVYSLFTLEQFGLKLATDPYRARKKYRLQWSIEAVGAFPFHVVPKSAPLRVANILYRGTDRGRMEAFCTSSGEMKWRFQATGTEISKKGIWSSPAYFEGKIYFGAYNGTLYCLDALTGQEIWSRGEGEWIGASPLIIAGCRLVLVGVEYARPWAQGSLSAFDIDTGEKKWEHLVEKLQHGSPAYDPKSGLVIWGSADYDMLGIKPDDGTVVWRSRTIRSVKYAAGVHPSLDLVAYASFDKKIYLAKASNGELAATWETGDLCYTTPLFVDQMLICGSGDRHLYIIDINTHKILRRLNLGARIYASPKLVNDSIFVGTNGGKLYEISSKTLEIVGVIILPDAITNAIEVSEDGKRLFIPTYMNHLYCYDRELPSNNKLPVPAKKRQAPREEEGRQDLRHFRIISSDVEVSEILEELHNRPDDWAINTSRQDKVTVQKETQSIMLRGVRRGNKEEEKTENIQDTKDTVLSANYPATMRLVNDYAASREARLGRVLFAKLPAGGKVYPHIDHGLYYATRDRLHLVVDSARGSIMECGGEMVEMSKGEIWWLDNKTIHSSFNGSNKDRIHLIFDLEGR